MTINENMDAYHFDIEGIRNANFQPFDHDYEPQLAPIQAVFRQDIPEKLKAFSPGTLEGIVDPYLPIAELRKKFEGKGRTLGGYILLIDGLRSRVSTKRQSLSNIPPWKDLTMNKSGYAAGPQGCPKVHPFAHMHLAYIMAYPERRLNYWETMFSYEKSIANAKTSAEVEEQLSAMREFTGLEGMGYDCGDKEEWRTFINGTRPAQQRQIAMPPDVVRIPDGGQLDWIDLERDIKDNIERMMQYGWFCITRVDVIACDMLGAYTVGVGEPYMSVNYWAEWGNSFFWTGFHVAWAMAMFNWIGSTEPEAMEVMREFIHDRYDLWIEEYMARPIEDYPGWWRYLPEFQREWMKEVRADYLEAVEKEKNKNR